MAFISPVRIADAIQRGQTAYKLSLTNWGRQYVVVPLDDPYRNQFPNVGVPLTGTLQAEDVKSVNGMMIADTSLVSEVIVRHVVGYGKMTPTTPAEYIYAYETLSVDHPIGFPLNGPITFMSTEMTQYNTQTLPSGTTTAANMAAFGLVPQLDVELFLTNPIHLKHKRSPYFYPFSVVTDVKSLGLTFPVYGRHSINLNLRAASITDGVAGTATVVVNALAKITAPTGYANVSHQEIQVAPIVNGYNFTIPVADNTPSLEAYIVDIDVTDMHMISVRLVSDVETRLFGSITMRDN